MKAIYKGKVEERRHHISKTIHLHQIKPSDSFSACINLIEKHYYTDRSFGGVQLYIYSRSKSKTAITVTETTDSPVTKLWKMDLDLDLL